VPNLQRDGLSCIAQPARPDRKIYPVKCKSCQGKGKITDAGRLSLLSLP
jgi:hypothetical protein